MVHTMTPMISTARLKNATLADLTGAHPTPAVPRLAMAFWETTVACNLTCAHCRRLDLRADHRQLSTSQGIDLIDQLADLGRPVLVFSGGEALMRPDFLPWPIMHYSAMYQQL